ncbi:indolepyruvate oxidoreductase subunit beta family protein [Flavisphingomonas formosensis]|uniref:indolepyruvate oxidoreductase subunit beta family protein n=1 Tax=Flavisphingomonas formosensis TaxID=861534 RepID=UPI0012FC5A21|nr:indolepyruvate oxidoreductase subunit beta family protein [Sphingomonas formosensis]
MEITLPADRDRITIAILALGGQGGGVLADWILEVANRNGYDAQGTSVPGVAQRTGSTVYYIEMARRGVAGANHPDPVLALMPVPGDVDIVIASELMEAGRAILRGFVTEDRTTLIGSTHRIYAISEKSAPGDGLASSRRIVDAAKRRAARFIGFDMDEAAGKSGSVISSIMFGALAGSEALPFTREMFEEAIRHGGKAVEANLKGFATGMAQAQTAATEADAPAIAAPEPTTEAGRAIKARIEAMLPPAAQPLAIVGAARLMDYQDAAYAGLYLDRLAAIRALDDGTDDWRLTAEAARHLALWMAYEDTIRVADLKIRATRSARVAREVRLADGQLLSVTEFMHPRLQEICETLPGWVAAPILRSGWLRRRLETVFARGRHVETTRLRWFLMLRLVAAMRTRRRSTLRYAEEQERIEHWLDLAREAAAHDVRLAAEILSCQRLIKGYADTFERGLARFGTLMTAARSLAGRADAAQRLAALREAALKDEQGTALSACLSEAGLAA